MQRSLLQRVVLVCAIAFMTVSFQNCESNTAQDIAGTDNQKNNVEKLNCPVPWADGLLVINGKSVPAFQAETVPAGESCQQEDRLCTDGVLSGSFAFASCDEVPVDLTGSCELPNGQKLANGMIQKLKPDNSAFADTDCGDYVEYTCTDSELTKEDKNLACPVVDSCTLPWGDVLENGKTVNAYKNAEAKDGASCEGENKEVRACNEGTLTGSFTNKACKPKDTTPKDLECKVHFKGGASAATKVKNKDQCLSYYAQIKANNPKSEIVKLTLDKKEIAIPKDAVKGDYVAYKVVGGKKTKLESKKDLTLAQARIACRAQVVKDASVGYECTFNGLMFERVEEPKAKECKIAFAGGGSIASQQKSEEKCKAYWDEVKKNNPQNQISKVTFGTKVLYTSQPPALGTLKITITKGGKTSGMGVADISLESAKKRCDTAIADNKGAGVVCEYNGKIIKEVKEVIVDSKKVCKVFFAGGGSAATDVKDKAGCEKYHAEIKKNNPQNEISKVTLDGKVIYEKKAEPKKTCKVFFAGGGSVATDVKDKAACEKNHASIKANNPGQTISKVTFDGKVIFEQKPVVEKKVCKMTFKDGGSISSKVETKAQCQAYIKELKKNNPNAKIKSTTFDGKAL